MYYLTYRPKTIRELDNEAPREIIKKILDSKTLPHAFLFVGQKGTGKTSTARIFAKAVNCMKNSFAKIGTSTEPCNTCDNCKSIDASSFPDVVELDAASNRGINEVKELIKEAVFLPIAGAYRIFIIDEAHMITNDGFNALLKTLEEPPSTVIFILATTNLEKVPKTIQSRCIQVAFGKAKPDELVHMLERIVSHEKLAFTKDALSLIAKHSDNSFRDAAKLLEELVMVKKTDPGQIQDYLGIRARQNLLTILSTQDIHQALAWIEEFSLTGGSVKNLIEDMLAQLHQHLLTKNKLLGGDTDSMTFSLPQTAMLMRLLNEAYVGLRTSPIESVPLEIAVVEFYNKSTVK